MSILDKASLIQIPSGYKSGKLYSIKPDNGDGDFDFSRSSSATRVNSEGLIETAQILGSEEIVNGDFATDSDWIKGSGWTISGGKANCNGSQLSVSDLQQNYDFSDGIKYKLTFDIIVTNGSITPYIGGVNTTSVTSTETNVTRYVIAGSSNHIKLRASSDFTGSIDNVSVKEVIENDVPRLDYSGGASCASLLLEPQSTNLVTYSEDYSDSSWTKVNASVSSNTATSPSGETNASTLVSTSGTSEQYLDVGSLSVTSGEDYTMSVFVKKNNYDFFLIRFTGVGGAFSAGNVFFNINNGTLGAIDSGYTGSIESFGNGWYRCSATKTASGTTASSKVRLQLAASDNTESISGDGSSGTFIYGSQFEQNSYPTSYIPSNSGSTTTRTADVCNNAGTSATFNSTEGVLFAEIAALDDDLTTRIISLSDGTNTNRIHLFYYSQSNDIAVNYRVSGSTVVSFVASLTDITNYSKVAFKWESGDFKMYVDGNLIDSDTNTTMLPADTIDTLSFSRGDGFENFYGKTKQLMTFNEALSDEELSDLTGQINTSFVQLANFYNYTIL